MVVAYVHGKDAVSDPGTKGRTGMARVWIYKEDVPQYLAYKCKDGTCISSLENDEYIHEDKSVSRVKFDGSIAVVTCGTESYTVAVG